MGISNEDAIKQLQSLMDKADESLKQTFQNVHQGYPKETYVRFLKARDWNVDKAYKMLIDCLNWRVENDVDWILAKPIIPPEFYRAIRESQLVGVSGYSKEGIPVIAIGVGHSTFDKASVQYYVQSHIQMNEYRDRVVLPLASKKAGRPITTCLKILDMTGLKLSALSQIKLLTIISTIDDLNYPEKTDTYFIVNAPYIFSSCWKVVKPLLQERTRRKIRVLQGSGKDELLKLMDYASLPHFCKKEGSGSSQVACNGGKGDNCFSFDNSYHQQLYNYTEEQSRLLDSVLPHKQGSTAHMVFPDPGSQNTKIAQTIDTQLHHIEDKNGFSRSLSESIGALDIKIN